MHRIITILTVTAAMLIGASRAGGQTTQPATTWQCVLDTLGRAVVTGDALQLRSVLAEKYTLHDFAGGREGEWPGILNELGGATVIGAHGAAFPPLSVAAELAGDVKAAPQIPDNIRVRYLPIDEIDMNRANATAVQWIGDALAAQNGDPVGVLSFWVDATARAGRAEQGQQALLFVLVLGQQLPSGEYRIVKIVYGNPLAGR